MMLTPPPSPPIPSTDSEFELSTPVGSASPQTSEPPPSPPVPWPNGCVPPLCWVHGMGVPSVDSLDLARRRFGLLDNHAYPSSGPEPRPHSPHPGPPLEGWEVVDPKERDRRSVHPWKQGMKAGLSGPSLPRPSSLYESVFLATESGQASTTPSFSSTSPCLNSPPSSPPSRGRLHRVWKRGKDWISKRVDKLKWRKRKSSTINSTATGSPQTAQAQQEAAQNLATSPPASGQTANRRSTLRVRSPSPETAYINDGGPILLKEPGASFELKVDCGSSFQEQPRPEASPDDRGIVLVVVCWIMHLLVWINIVRLAVMIWNSRPGRKSETLKGHREVQESQWSAATPDKSFFNRPRIRHVETATRSHDSADTKRYAVVIERSEDEDDTFIAASHDPLYDRQEDIELSSTLGVSTDARATSNRLEEFSAATESTTATRESLIPEEEEAFQRQWREARDRLANENFQPSVLDPCPAWIDACNAMITRANIPAVGQMPGPAHYADLSFRPNTGRSMMPTQQAASSCTPQNAGAEGGYWMEDDRSIAPTQHIAASSIPSNLDAEGESGSSTENEPPATPTQQVADSDDPQDPEAEGGSGLSAENQLPPLPSNADSDNAQSLQVEAATPSPEEHDPTTTPQGPATTSNTPPPRNWRFCFAITTGTVTSPSLNRDTARANPPVLSDPRNILRSCLGRRHPFVPLVSPNQSFSSQSAPDQFTAGTSSQSTLNQATSSQWTSNQATSNQAKSSQSTLTQATSTQATSGQSSSNQSTANQPTSTQATSSQATATQASATQATPNQPMSNQPTLNQNNPNQEDSNQRESNQGASAQATSEQGTSAQGTSNQVTGQAIVNAVDPNQVAGSSASGQPATSSPTTPSKPIPILRSPGTSYVRPRSPTSPMNTRFETAYNPTRPDRTSTHGGPVVPYRPLSGGRSASWNVADDSSFEASNEAGASELTPPSPNTQAHRDWLERKPLLPTKKRQSGKFRRLSAESNAEASTSAQHSQPTSSPTAPSSPRQPIQPLDSLLSTQIVQGSVGLELFPRQAAEGGNSTGEDGDGEDSTEETDAAKVKGKGKGKMKDWFWRDKGK